MASLLTDQTLEGFRERAPKYDRENTFFTEDFEELRDAGYLKLSTPKDFGGEGANLAETAREQRRLASYAPADAVAVNMHVYWTGLAADLHHVGDSSLDWLLDDAGKGGVYAAGHSERGNDITGLLSTTNAERADGGWKITGHKNFGTMTPVWTKLGLHAMDVSNPEAPQIVHGFLDRDAEGIEIVETWDSLGMRATRSDDTVINGSFIPDGQVARVIPAGAAGMDLFVLGIFAWALVGFSNVYYSIARRMLDLTVDYVGEKTSLGLGGGPYSKHPEIQHTIAEMAMRLDAMEPLLESVATGYSESVRDAGNWTEMTAPGWVRRIVGMKHVVTKSSLEVANMAVEAVGGLGVARHSEFERLFRDARMGPIHPANPQLAHEIIGKITLGLDLDAQPRWGG
jgi:alkylation response protein AidB-like acyl-CoA dehydrogenase